MPALGSQLLLAALFVSVGFIGGALVCLWWFERQKQTSDATHKPASDTSTDQGIDDKREVLRLLRDRLNGKLILMLGGKTHASTKTLSPIQRQDLVKLLPELAAWVRTEGELPTKPLMAITPIEPQAAAKTPEELAAARIVPPLQTPAAAAPLPGVISPRSGGTGPLPALVLVDPSAVKEPKAAPPKSIVAQINDILQDRIPGTPLEGKGVRLAEDLRHGVIVWIGVEKFTGIDAVPDPEIQKAIRSAVNEWEEQAERNRIK